MINAPEIAWTFLSITMFLPKSFCFIGGTPLTSFNSPPYKDIENKVNAKAIIHK